ncbi:MAG: DUF3316 domain-containing protein [Candidatus Azobacteroides sp.]|nr:DUF3316 domain-containing protein [Candidatus Azobacteroides sp.]
MRKIIYSFFFLFHYLLLPAQEEKLFSTNRATLYGIGATSMLDTYLSPLRYTGMEIRIVTESNRMSKYKEGRLSIQNRVDFSLSSTKNPADNATEYSAFLNWNWGYHYRFPVNKNLKLLAGGLTYVSAGAIYNLRNGNNPVAAKIGTGVAASGMGIYNFNIKEQPFTGRFQFIVPVGGAIFSPGYGQSYYEIFGLGNYDNIIHFSSWHNLFICKSIFSFDIPFNRFTIRTAYQYDMYISNLNHLKTELYSHTFMIGLVSEFIKIKGKKQPGLAPMIQSAYY